MKMVSKLGTWLVPVFVILLVGMSTASEITAEEEELSSMVERHEQWMVRHNRSYADEAEKAKRFLVFKKNAEFVDSFNKGDHSYTLGLNDFSDLTDDEFTSSMMGNELTDLSSD
ncbi:unnamed protein product [Cuscuta epithymum]|uniref:Cathepsin propeptide inhibitor domain-containing protein n=1 Tax=Cuscuta epithymum TaxID=186058 RepID=A0AAV0F1A8_9ASTE|nr:unnamed protein product [Cuscuta epithymum]CAH9129296.1 unnamed protein product [Cuscuta epithymum]CAH9129300.1 unnamed protein product [Cuscuta epithymum]